MKNKFTHKLFALLIAFFAMLFIIIPSLVTVSVQHSDIIEKTLMSIELLMLLTIVFLSKKSLYLYVFIIFAIIFSLVINIQYTYWLQSESFPKNLLNDVISEKPTKPSWYK